MCKAGQHSLFALIVAMERKRDTSRRRVARMAAGASYGTAKCSRLD
jgi:hypothetical protein